jgi:hydroxypyruvate isomerase
MPQFCANLTMLYNEVDFIERFGAAAKSGFKGVEFLFPYAYPKDQIAGELAKHKLTQVLHNLPAGDWAKGERGIACRPDRVGEFQDGVGKAIEYATALGCKQVNCLAGIPPQGVPEEKLRATFVANLKFAAPKLAQAGIKLLVEAINTRDIPGFYLTRTKQAVGILDEVGSPNLWVQYDIYHMQIMEGDLARGMQENLARIAHLQLADNPGRNEPGTGEINYPFLFEWIDRIGYQGWIGCEYKPKGDTVAGLGWIKSYL